MHENHCFPYINTFPLPEPEFTRKIHYPAEILAARGVISPQKLRENGTVTFLQCGGENAFVTLDFQDEYAGALEFEISGTGKLDISYGESVGELDCDRDAVCQGWYDVPHDIVTLTSTVQSIRIYRRAFRYLKLTNDGGEMRIEHLRFISEGHPVELRGSFVSSDARLNHIWRICEHTMRLCMQRYFEDGVKRDTMCWGGDSRVEALAAYSLFGDTEIARRSLCLMANSQRDDGLIPASLSHGGGKIPDVIPYMFPHEPYCILEFTAYSADALAMLWEYYLYSADDATMQELFPFFLRQARLLGKQCNAQPFPGVIFARHGKTHSKPFDTINDEASVRASALASLKNFIRLAEVLGRQEEVRCLQEDVAKLETLIRSLHMISPTAPVQMIKPPEPITFSAQTFALFAGLLTPPHAAAVFRNLLSGKLPMAYPRDGFTRYWMLRGLAHSGLTQKALTLLRRDWGFLLKHGATTCWENWDLDDIPYSFRYDMSRCHGWSAGPADFFARHLLGVTPLTPGYQTVAIRPNLCNLQWFEGTVPTPHGDIFVRCERGKKPVWNLPEGIVLA